MNRKVKIILGIIILLIVIGIQISYAIPGQNNNSNSFFSVNKERIEQKGTLRLIFELNKIEYDNFKIVLNSNIDNSQIQVNNNVTVQEESNAVVVEIDKTKMNFNSIEMSYVVPEDTPVNSQIQLSAKVTVIEENQEKIVLEECKNVIVIEESENKEQEQEQNENNKQPEDNNKDNSNKPSDFNNNNNNKNNNDFMANTEKIGSSSNKQISASNYPTSNGTTSNSENSSMGQLSKSVETAVYNGSNNNYLEELKVEGAELNTSFSKENTTYFITVTNTDSLNITATAEDSSAKVYITGNDSIKEGTNKVLISVTAENGETRYYRIFVKYENTSQDNKNKTTLNQTSEVASALIENVELHATYYLAEAYVENNSYVAKGENILKYTNGTYLTAPYDCYIVELNLPEVEGKCLNSHYVKIQSKNMLAVSMNIDEKNIGKISIGQEVEVTISSLDNTYKGYVTHIGSSASNKKFTIDIQFENDGKVKLGMTSSAEIKI